MAPARDASRQALISASADLTALLAAFENHMAGITESAKAQAVTHIAGQTEDLARRSARGQTRTMEAAARMLFSAKHLAHQGAHPWHHGQTHAATAAEASGPSNPCRACKARSSFRRLLRTCAETGSTPC